MALPLAAAIGARYPAGFQDRATPLAGLAAPLAGAFTATLLVIALASLRHVRQALALRPIEALD